MRRRYAGKDFHKNSGVGHDSQKMRAVPGKNSFMLEFGSCAMLIENWIQVCWIVASYIWSIGLRQCVPFSCRLSGASSIGGTGVFFAHETFSAFAPVLGTVDVCYKQLIIGHNSSLWRADNTCFRSFSVPLEDCFKLLNINF